MNRGNINTIDKGTNVQAKKQRNEGYSPDSMQIHVTSRGGESLTLTGFSHLHVDQ